MYSIIKRVEKVEKQLCIGIGEKPPVVFDYTDENGIDQKIEMPSDDFDKLLKDIRAESKGLPVKERAAA